MKDVTIYTTGACPYCTSAKALLMRTYGTTPIEIRVDTDREKLSEMVTLTERRTVPQIFVGSDHIGGYDELRRLHEAGKLLELLS